MTPPITVTLSDADFAVPIEDRYFEDYVPGAVYVYGSVTMREEDILRFAREFDPQGIHTDQQTALHGPYQGLIASGWHTCAVMMRMYADHYISKVGGLASPGVDELRWVRPVRPGDSLSLRTTVRESRVSRSRPDRGLVHTGIEVLNQHGEAVLTMTAVNFLLLRNAAGSSASAGYP
ncbi:MaoC family dehydratase [Streptomyces spinosirectus]|jgi:acyl dehydratase|uniref:MaoC family dehydratase n=1 Tax=Streptomyces TaxID=1883 RepID=UPI001C9E1597|nr:MULTISPECIES: MaoC family dehydratase [Streptomyces]MBY8339029.1 MaoC family dehydratase [Streptomyces plumbidurans]UIR21810.1 MaoC family dehydratase [Streptomyces spinosirectus]